MAHYTVQFNYYMNCGDAINSPQENLVKSLKANQSELMLICHNHL